MDLWQQKVNHNQMHAEILAKLEPFKWDIEELHVSLFAKELKTPYPVSIKRLSKQLDLLSSM